MRRMLTILILAVVTVVATAPAAAQPEYRPQATASVNDTVIDVVYHGDTVYLGGEFTTAYNRDGEAVRRTRLAAIDATTGELSGFAPSLDGTVHAVATDGEYLYAGGTFQNVDGHRTPRIARFDLATGDLDEDFDVHPTAAVYALAVAGERVYLGGTFHTVNGADQQHLAAVDRTDGALDTEFDPEVRDGAVYDIDSGHGRLYISGSFNSVDGMGSRSKLAAVDPVGGRVDLSFNARGVDVFVRDIDVTAERVYGALGGRGGQISALDLRGRTEWYVAVDGDVQAVTVLGDTVYGGGHFDRVCVNNHAGPRGECVDGVMVDRRKLIAVDGDGQLLDWAPEPDSVLGVMALDASARLGTVAVGGAFATFGRGSHPQRAFAQFG